MSDPHVSPFARFTTTIWPDVDLVKEGSTPSVKAFARARLVERYLPALRAHLMVKRRIDSNVADDLLQGFVTDKLLDPQRDLFAQADPERGKLRSFLVKSLENYAWKKLGRERETNPLEPARPETLPDFFDVAWARQVLEETVTAVHDDCLRKDQQAIWGVFQERCLIPLTTNAAPVPYQELALKYHFQSPAQAANALTTAKHKFRKAFRQTVAKYLEECQDLDQVVSEILVILSKAQHGDWRDVSAALPEPEVGQAQLRHLLSGTSPALVASQLGAEDSDENWTAEDLAAMLQQQLQLPLHELSDQLDVKLSTAGGGALGEYLREPQSRVDLLKIIKQHFKKQAREEDGGLPPRLATTIYFASIAAELVHCGQRSISDSDDDLLRNGFQRVLGWDWVDEEIQQLLEQACRKLSPASA